MTRRKTDDGGELDRLAGRQLLGDLAESRVPPRYRRDHVARPGSVMLAGGARRGRSRDPGAPPWWLQILVATGVSISMLLLLRPTLIARVRNMPGYRSSTGKMVGSSGVAISQIDRSAAARSG